MSAEQLLKMFGDKIQFECIHPDHKKDPKKYPIYRSYGLYKLHKATLDMYNNKGYGIYFTVNETDSGTKRKEENIVRARAVWLDDDSGEVDDKVFTLPPSCVVESSPGKRHFYWFTETVDLDKWQEVMDGIASSWGGDRGAKLKTQILRLPGYVNTKYKGKHVTSIVGGNFKRYSFDNVYKIFPKLAKLKDGKRDSGGSGESGSGKKLELSTAMKEILTGESLYPNILRLSASLVSKGMPRNDVVDFLSSVLDLADAEEDRVNNCRTKLGECVDTACQKYLKDKARVGFSEESYGPPTTMFDWPPGNLGTIARQINQCMMYPSPEIAIASAMHTVSVLACGGFHWGGSMVNIIRTILAKNGRGKKISSDFFYEAIASIDAPEMYDKFVCDDSFTSQNIQASLNAHRVKSMIIPEAGLVSGSTAGDKNNLLTHRLNAISITVGATPLKVPEISRNNKSMMNDRVKPVYCPVLVVLDESTPDTYLGVADKHQHIESGALARTELIFVGDETERNRKASTSKLVTPEIADMLNRCVRRFMDMECSTGLDTTVVHKMVEVDFSEVEEQYEEYIDSLVEVRNSDGIERAVVVRLPSRVKVTCIILASIDDPDGAVPKVTKEHLDYAIAYQEEINRAILSNSHSGDMASAMSQCLDVLFKYLRTAGTTEDKDRHKLSYGGHITSGWLSRKLRSGRKPFKRLQDMYPYKQERDLRKSIMAEAADRGAVMVVKSKNDEWEWENLIKDDSIS